jgi:hypothetical protein
MQNNSLTNAFGIHRQFWIDIHYACFGIIAVDDIITAAPPIVAWMVSKQLTEVKPWLLRKKARVIEIKRS